MGDSEIQHSANSKKKHTWKHSKSNNHSKQTPLCTVQCKVIIIHGLYTKILSQYTVVTGSPPSSSMSELSESSSKRKGGTFCLASISSAFKSRKTESSKKNTKQ